MMLAGCRHGKTGSVPEEKKEPPLVNLSGTISISGAYALSPLARTWADSFMKINPGVKVEIVENGTGQGIKALMNKEVQLAMISRPLTDEEKDAGIWVVPVAKDGVAPIVNSKNPYLQLLLQSGLSPDEFQKVFTRESPVKWSELLDTDGNEKVMVFSRADESGAADMFASFLFKKAADLKGTKVTGDNQMIKSVQENPLALGFCNFSYAFSNPNGERTDNIQVIPFDLDFDNKVDRKEIPFRNLDEAHRSVWLGIYPDMLCRELTFGSIGKPTDPLVKEFLKYILTSGQDNVKTAGLCKLNDVYINYSLDLLK